MFCVNMALRDVATRIKKKRDILIKECSNI